MKLKADDFEHVQAYTPMIRIAHSIPGRIRLKLEGTSAGMKQVAVHAKRFSDAWREIPGIRSAKLNLAARSCTVEYDESLIPFRAWADLLGGVRSSEALELLGLFKRRYETLLRG